MTGRTVREELRELVCRYAQALDRRDAEALVALFTPDATFGGLESATPRYSGHDDLRRMVRQVDASFVKTLHCVCNQTTDLHADGAQAQGETYCLAHHVVEHDDGGWTLLEMAIRYLDGYVVDQGRWKFQSRRTVVEWVARRPASPFHPAMLSEDPERLI
jgi:ketosteroid isomerase-like protein